MDPAKNLPGTKWLLADIPEEIDKPIVIEIKQVGCHAGLPAIPFQRGKISSVGKK